MACRIKEWRIEHGYTQKQICEMIGMPRRTLENYEAEVRTPPTWVEDLVLDKLNSIEKGQE